MNFILLAFFPLVLVNIRSVKAKTGCQTAEEKIINPLSSSALASVCWEERSVKVKRAGKQFLKTCAVARGEQHENRSETP